MLPEHRAARPETVLRTRGNLPDAGKPVLAADQSEARLEAQIAADARTRLRVGGWLLLEHAYDQKDRCVELLLELGYADVGDFQDLAGWPRVCAGRWLD